MPFSRPRRTFSKRRRSTRGNRSSRLVWIVVILGLCSALALALYGVLHGGFGRDTHSEWLQLAKTLRQQGEPVYLADMKPPDIPSGQNFFDAEVFKGLAEGSPAHSLLQRAATPGQGLDVAALLAAATKENGASLDSIASAMQSAGLVRGKTDFLLAADRVRAGMRALGLDFSPLDEAADRPTARFPIDYTQPFPELPHLHYLEALGDWLAIRSIAQLSIGNGEAAAHDLLLIARLADATATEPFLRSQRTRRQLLGLFAGCVRVGIDWGAWSGEQLARFADTLECARLLADFALALRGERAQLNTVIDQALRGYKPAASEKLQAWFGSDLVHIDKRSLRTRQVSINLALQHFIEALSAVPIEPASLEPGDSGALPPAARERFTAIIEDARIFAQIQAYLTQAEIACALERYRLARGVYPGKLADLAPEWLAAVPNDPLTGRLPGYMKKGDGFVLTGAGWTDGQPWTWTRR